jgi:hypothetical protein
MSVVSRSQERRVFEEGRMCCANATEWNMKLVEIHQI